jgi:hypothetical protein
VSPLLEDVWQTLRPRVAEFKTSEVQQQLLQQHPYGPLALLEDLDAYPARGEADVIALRMLPHVSSRPVRLLPLSMALPSLVSVVLGVLVWLLDFPRWHVLEGGFPLALSNS